MVVIPRSATAERPAPRRNGRDVDDDLVDQAGRDERGGQGGAALQEDVLAIADPQLGEGLVRVAGAQVDGLGVVVEDPPVGREVALPHHDAQRLDGQRPVVSSRTVSSGSSTATVLVPTSIVSHSARSRWVSRRAARRGDPARGAVGGGAAPVEGGGELPGDEGALLAQGDAVDLGERGGLVGEQARLDLDAGGLEPRAAAGGDRVGVGLGIDHPAYAGRDERLRARTRAAGVVAGLEGDDGGRAAGGSAGPGQRVGLGVGGAGTAVVALGDRRAVVGEEHAADPAGVVDHRDTGRRGQHQGAAHRVALRWCGRHVSSGPVGLTDSGDDGGLDGSTADGRPTATTTCVRFPSGLSPSVQDFHLVNRSLGVSGSRTLTAGSELHRPQSTRAMFTRRDEVPQASRAAA